MSSRIETAKTKDLAEMTERWKHALADYQNLERRSAQFAQSTRAHAKADVIREFLPLIESIKQATNHHDGSLPLLKEAQAVLSNLGVEETAQIGADFDPSQHEAVEMVGGEHNNKIAEIINQGYRLGEVVIKPAKVIVSMNTVSANNIEKPNDAQSSQNKADTEGETL